MSNLWKLYGLAYSRRDFFEEATKMAKTIRPRDFTRDPKGKDRYHAALVDIDKFLVKWRCPLDHIDVQLFYDLLCCQTLWDNFEKVLTLTKMNLTNIDPGDPEASVFWQVLGLCCLDPWRNQNPNGSEHPGFRQLLQKDISNAAAHGFILSDKYAKMIANILAIPKILDALQGIAMCWLPGSRSMMLNREEYMRLQPIEIPPGWVDLSKP
jgi:hypothetical protein